MIAKLAALAGSGALLLSAVVPTFAFGGWGGWGQVKKAPLTITTEYKSAVISETTSNANTGDNVILNHAGVAGSKKSGATAGGSLFTGDALAQSLSVNVANAKADCGCEVDNGKKNVKTTYEAVVASKTAANANTGRNLVTNHAGVLGAKDSGATAGGPVVTGHAASSATSINAVNVHLNGFEGWIGL